MIGSLSLGATRIFQLRRKDYRRSGVPWEELSLTGGSLLVMRGSTQRLVAAPAAEADRPDLRRTRQPELPLDRTSRNVENSRGFLEVCQCICVLFVCIVWLASASALACDYPPRRPKIPDGKTATSEQMTATQQAIKDYVTKMEAYIACIDESVKNLPEPLTKEQEHIHVEKHNAAVDEMQGVADTSTPRCARSRRAGQPQVLIDVTPRSRASPRIRAQSHSRLKSIATSVRASTGFPSTSAG